MIWFSVSKKLHIPVFLNISKVYKSFLSSRYIQLLVVIIDGFYRLTLLRVFHLVFPFPYFSSSLLYSFIVLLRFPKSQVDFVGSLSLSIQIFIIVIMFCK